MDDVGYSSEEPDLNRKMLQLCEDELQAHEKFMLVEYVKHKKANDIMALTIYTSWMD